MLNFRNVLGHTFCTTFLVGPRPTVVDCGANRGEFARFCAEAFGARVVAFEADPELAGPANPGPLVTFVNKAVAGVAGTIEVRQSAGTCSSIRFHETGFTGRALVEATTLADIMQAHDLEHVDLLKLDIEGAELDVFERAARDTLGRCTQITCEFHDFLSREDIPRIRRIMQTMSADFHVVSISLFTYGDVLFVNRDRTRGWRFIRAQLLVHKYVEGLRRTVRRLARQFTRHGTGSR